MQEQTRLAPEIEQIREVNALAKRLAGSENPLVHNVAVQMLGLSKLLVAEIAPDEFQHISDLEASPRAG